MLVRYTTGPEVGSAAMRLSFFFINFPSVGAFGIEPKRPQKRREGYNLAWGHASLRTRKRRSRRGDLPGRLQNASAISISLIYASGAFPS